MPIDPPEVIEIEDAKVHCDGGGALGHPRVYYDLHTHGYIDCGYCDRRFIWSRHPAAEAIRAGRPPVDHDRELTGRA